MTKKELQREQAYHANCAKQYRTAAARLKSEKMSLRAIDNAQFHERQLEEINRKLAKFSK